MANSKKYQLKSVGSKRVTVEMVKYLSYHGVYHPTKQSKIRFLFDGSSKFNGKSFHKKLQTGLCLAQQLDGVLTRFRQAKIIFMADMENMYS